MDHTNPLVPWPVLYERMFALIADALVDYVTFFFPRRASKLVWGAVALGEEEA